MYERITGVVLGEIVSLNRGQIKAANPATIPADIRVCDFPTTDTNCHIYLNRNYYHRVTLNQTSSKSHSIISRHSCAEEMFFNCELFTAKIVFTIKIRSIILLWSFYPTKRLRVTCELASWNYETVFKFLLSLHGLNSTCFRYGKPDICLDVRR